VRAGQEQVVQHSHALIPVERIKPNPRNARTHSKKQIRQIARSITEFGFASAVLVDEQNMLIAGHARLEAATVIGMASIPAITIRGLSDAKKRALMLADNRIAQNGGWDREKLAIELEELSEPLKLEGTTIDLTGFEPPEIDVLLADLEDSPTDPADDINADGLDGPATTCTGDLWQLGKHRVLCGDARNATDVGLLLGDERAHMGFFDPPYNVKVSGIVGRGVRKHREFAMASGEMSSDDFVSFLGSTLGTAARFSVEGAVAYVCMDWRHYPELAAASRGVFGEILNLVVWDKINAGQGSFYRSRHELIGVFRVGSAPHLNNIQLGRHGRNRSNVWSYPGANTFRKGRLEDLRAHPTVKPVAMIADAIKDCSRRGQIVLDTFCGSGTTLLAAERVGRQGRGLEIDPRYVDLTIRRWQSFTGRDAVHIESGLTFEEMSARRICTSSTTDQGLQSPATLPNGKGG
jgi:DNA modification methylase